MNEPRTVSGAGRSSWWRRAARVFVFLWFLLGGIAHFVTTDLIMLIVPPWLPEPRAIVWFTGVLELAGAAGLVSPRTRRAAGVVLALLTVAVTPANIYMLHEAARFDVPVWVLVLRLPLQLVLLWLIVWGAEVFPAARASR